MDKELKPEGTLRTRQEQEAAVAYARLFSDSPDSLEVRLATFPKYIRRQEMTRLLALYELFKKVINTKGSVVECGVWRGFGLMAWANFSAVLEPANLTRRIYGFDTFQGFPSPDDRDQSSSRTTQAGELGANSYDEIHEAVRIFDSNRFLGHVNKVELIKGDAKETIPQFVSDNPHLVVSLLFLDFDLYQPTKTALEHFLPRMPKGAIIAFDELDNPIWPGETHALMDTLGISKLKIQRLDFDPYIGYALIE